MVQIYSNYNIIAAKCKMGACHRCIAYQLTSLKTKYLAEEFCQESIGKVVR